MSTSYHIISNFGMFLFLATTIDDRKEEKIDTVPVTVGVRVEKYIYILDNMS